MRSIKVAAALSTVLSLLVFAADASATTLEINGAQKNEAITTQWSLKEHSLTWKDTFGTTATTCTTSTLQLSSASPFTGTAVGGPISVMSFGNCTEGTPTVDAKGSLSVTNIAGTTNGTVRSSGAKVTVPSFFGTLTCTTENTDLGTLIGKKEGSANLNVQDVWSCTVLGSVITEAIYTLTSPINLGVGA